MSADELTARVTDIRESDSVLSTRDQALLTIIEARAIALRADYEQALDMLEGQRAHERLPANLRLRNLSLATNLAINADDYSRSFRLLQQALLLSSVQGSDSEHASTLGLAAYVLGLIDLKTEALAMARTSLSLAMQTDDLQQRCTSSLRFVVAAADKALADEAMAASHSGRSFCAQSGGELFGQALLIEQGRLLARAGELEAGLAQLVAGEAYYEGLGFPDGVLSVRVYRIQALLDNQRLDQAATLVRSLAEELDLDEQKTFAKHIHGWRALIAAHEGDWQQALQWRRKDLLFHQRWLPELQSRQLDYVRAQQEVDLRSDALALATERQRAAALDARNAAQSRLTIGLAILSVVAVIMLLLTLLAYSRISKRRLRWLVEHDLLTGLLGHRHFLREIAHACDQADTEITLLVADADHFKALNDRYGHLAGDQALIHIARVFAKEFGDIAVLGRLGGEEFGILVLNRDEEEVMRRLERTRQAVREFRFDGLDVGLSLSFGVLREYAPSDAAWLRRSADTALYRAKRDGRDRVVRGETHGG